MNKSKSEKYELREIFLKGFTKHLIINSQLNNNPFLNKINSQNSELERELGIPSIKLGEEIPSLISPKPLGINVPVMSYSGNPLQELKKLIMDSRVQTIECSGPDKPILITESGRIQPIGLKLNRNEINRIITEFSEKTKIPIVSGMFKAALGNILITAVISEYIGTRFLIQKGHQAYYSR